MTAMVFEIGEPGSIKEKLNLYFDSYGIQRIELDDRNIPKPLPFYNRLCKYITQDLTGVQLNCIHECLYKLNDLYLEVVRSAAEKRHIDHDFLDTPFLDNSNFIPRGKDGIFYNLHERVLLLFPTIIGHAWHVEKIDVILCERVYDVMKLLVEHALDESTVEIEIPTLETLTKISV